MRWYPIVDLICIFTTNKASRGNGIPVELFQILKDDAVKVLHSICQQIWKTQQWPQDWKRSIFIPIPNKDNAKECSKYHTTALISHASTLAWKIPWTEEPGRLKSMRSLRVEYNWATSLSLFIFMHWRRKWQPTAVFLPGESHGQRSLVGYSPRAAKSRTWLSDFTFTLLVCEMSAIVDIAFFWHWNENWPFPVLWPPLSFPNLLAYWVQHFHSIIF